MKINLLIHYIQFLSVCIDNPLPVKFKSLLHGQEGCIFFSGHLNLRTCQYVGVRLAWQATFKSSTFWYVRAGKGLKCLMSFLWYVYGMHSLARSLALMVWNRDTTYDSIEGFFITVMHEFLKLSWQQRILWIIRQTSRTSNQLSFCLAFITIY
jgi:hypothetical protein